MTNQLLRYTAFCEDDDLNHHCGHNITDRGECYDVIAVDNLIAEYDAELSRCRAVISADKEAWRDLYRNELEIRNAEIRRLNDEVDALRPDSQLGRMLVQKAKEVEALAPGIPRIIICDAVAAELIERLCESEEGEEAVL